MESTDSPPTKKLCFGNLINSDEPVKHVRPFTLTQQFPSRNTTGQPEINDPGNSVVTKDVEQMHTILKLKSPNGKDLGEFKVKFVAGNNGAKTVMLTKSQLTKIDKTQVVNNISEQKASTNISDFQVALAKPNLNGNEANAAMSALSKMYIKKETPQSMQHRPTIIRKKAQLMKKIIIPTTISPQTMQQKIVLVDSRKVPEGNPMSTPNLLQKTIDEESVTQSSNSTRNVEPPKSMESLKIQPVTKSYSRANKNVMVMVSNKTHVDLEQVMKTKVNNMRINGTFERIHPINHVYNEGMIKKFEENGFKAEKSTQKEVSQDNLDIIEKALNSIADKELREKALKALADCGIGFMRHVPIRPPLDMKAVHDSSTQTDVFGVFEQDFVVVSENSESVERKSVKRISLGSMLQQRLMTNGAPFATVTHPFTNEELDEVVEKFISKNKADEFQRALKKDLPEKVIKKWKKDYRAMKEYDSDGLLGIHRAVLSNEIRKVRRYISVLKMCRENIDIPTEDEMSSLELAVDYDISDQIVRLLLNNNAAPTSSDITHESALIIACKKLSTLIPILVKYIPDVKMLNVINVKEGYAPIHYCAKLNYLDGVEALIKAGADVNLADLKSGRTALFHALENRQMEMGIYLLENGAISSIPTLSGHTVIQMLDELKNYKLKTLIHKQMS